MNYKNIITFLLISIPCLLFAGYSKTEIPDKNFHIYLLMGQSNMAGRGEVSGIYKNQSHPRVLMLDQNSLFIKAKHPLHFDKIKVAGVGPGFSFGISMAEENEEVEIGLVPCAVGGTSINKWIPGAYDKNTNTHPYDDALVRIKEAMKIGVIKGVIWHQGEGDSDPEKAKIYLQNLSELITRIRGEVNNPTLPFVVGELARYRESYNNINEELLKLPSVVADVLVVSSEGLWHKGDGTHFDSPSATEFGFRFADGMLQLQGEKNKTLQPLRSKYNILSEEEKKEGWELLFDGREPGKRWRSINGFAFPSEGWRVEDETLVLLPGQKGKDIITREEFSDFELVLDFKLTDSANTGIKYFVTGMKDRKGNVKLNGLEFQLIDDYKHKAVSNNKDPKASTASLYLLYAPTGKKLKKAGLWNQAKIISKGNKVEHWLNGKRVLSYERGSEDFKNRVSETKFNELENYGVARSGHILLQDHKDKVYFRNIKIRRLN